MDPMSQINLNLCESVPKICCLIHTATFDVIRIITFDALKRNP